jgi:AbrB family looped-hinge helix DNA binding protein
MRLTTKGQVTIPQHIRKKLGLTSHSEVEFVEEKGQVIVKKARNGQPTPRFRALRGRANVRMTTEEILSLTRDPR